MHVIFYILSKRKIDQTSLLHSNRCFSSSREELGGNGGLGANTLPLHALSGELNGLGGRNPGTSCSHRSSEEWWGENFQPTKNTFRYISFFKTWSSKPVVNLFWNWLVKFRSVLCQSCKLTGGWAWLIKNIWFVADFVKQEKDCPTELVSYHREKIHWINRNSEFWTLLRWRW